ncbi:MAG: selenoneine biosynthesis selenosugar synthase SenB [Rubrivivax sp.]
MHRPSLVLVTPALASANNGNWQTAKRWSQLLSDDYRVRVAERWGGGDEALLIALHARRSAASVAAWRAAHPRRPLLLALTGTDLYRDIAVDAPAQVSIEAADRLVVLQALGRQALPAHLRRKAVVIVQSAPTRQTVDKTGRHLRALMVGHLRDEKDPLTLMRAARLLSARDDILVDHIGGALDPALADAARRTMADCPHYRWLGARPHAETRRRIQHAHVLVHASRLEGGAHVVIEAVASGTPVLASRIDGNLGLLGRGYRGVFEPGDAAGLAALLQRCRDEPAMLARLQGQCARRAPLFEPARERSTLLRLVDSLMNRSR